VFALVKRFRGFAGASSTPAMVRACVCVVAILSFGFFVAQMETDWFFIVPVLGAFAFIAALCFALTLRASLAIAVSLIFFAMIWAAALAKFALVAMNPHVYDVIFYVFSVSQIAFAFSAYPQLAWLIVAAVASGAGLICLAARLEPRAKWSPRRRIALASIACILLVPAVSPLADRNGQFFSEKRFVFSAFLSSFGDLPQLVRFKGLIEVSAAPSPTPQGVAPISCTPTRTPPDIVLFLNESAMPSGVYPELNYPDELKSFFADDGGRVHPLRVETFGGGTWLTDFSALTGLSTRSFGSMRNFVSNFMTGRLRHSLPQYLKACGYETSMIYPASADFAGVGRFYQAIGFDKIIDLKVHHAPDQRQRDAFYLGEAAKILEANAARPAPKPQFIVASSMSTHSPWDFRYAPDQIRESDNLRWNADAEFDEYLWRLVLAKRDRDAFRARLASTMPTREILQIGYGDHQPGLAKIPLANAQAVGDNGTSWQLDPTSKAFETYYSIDAQNFKPVWQGRDLPIVEVAHLATIAVIAAGLPLDAVYQRRAQLLTTCKGLYATCADRAAVLTFQRWLVDSHWLAQN
jgi:hypothetical protein